MSSKNSFSGYGSIAKAFHWATVLLIFSAFPVGYFANELAHQIRAAGFDGNPDIIARAQFLFSLHKTLGVTVLFTAIARILWAATQEKPGLLHPDNKPEALVAEAVHWLLYGLMVLVPLSGWIMHASEVGYAPIWWPFSQGLPFVPKSETVAGLAAGVHWLFVWSLFGIVSLHILGALKHHIIDKDATLRRMLPGGGDLPTPPSQSHDLKSLVLAAAILLAILGYGAGTGVFEGHDHAHDHGQAAAQDHDDHDHGHGHGHTDDTAPETPQQAEATGQDAWTVDAGVLAIELTQMGSQIEGTFNSWTSDIQFAEPNAPGPAGKVTVTVDIGSLSLGSVTSQALGADFFNASVFPTAVFDADIEKLDSGYQAVGTLTIRDRSRPFTLPFDLDLDGKTATMTGQSTLQRLDYDVGLSQKDESTVGFSVAIKINLKAHHSGES